MVEADQVQCMWHRKASEKINDWADEPNT